MTGWPSTPLKRALRPGGRSTSLIKGDAASEPAPGLVPGFSASGQDVWLDRPLYEGPGLVLSAVGARCGKVFEASGRWGVVANTSVLIPQPGHDPHFLWYLVNDEGFWERGGTAQPYVRVPESLEKVVPLPPLGSQRAVADYLDTETARIDALINKKQQLRMALRERYASVVRLELGYDEGIKLKHLLAAPLAYGVLVPSHDPEGIPMLRITDLRTGTVNLNSVNRIPESLSNEFRRTILRNGDVVVSVVGTLGRSLEVTPQLAGANLNRALARVRLKHDVPRALIRLWFQSEDFQLQARLATSGDSAQPTLGLGDMKNFNLGIPRDSSRWAEIADRTLHRLAPIEKAVSKLQDQERLLVEHRQALITAAVTGELEIPGVAS